ncbi:MAG: TIGR01777 family protein [Planctomycetes bacterium]|nr:TIGR01777 family protein [Planctomycetota bacterium]
MTRRPRLAVTGSNGLVGKALCRAAPAAGWDVVRLVRSARGDAGTASWNPATGAIDAQALGAVDAVVHLAGENVAGGRWTKARKAAIADSRGPATEKLCRALAALPQPPKVLVSASATGIYGDRGDETLDEASAPGVGFLADVARAWEAGTAPLAQAGARVVLLRIGVVLARGGGALPRMLPPFRLGLGGPLGSGRQWMSWISLPDLVRAILFALGTERLRGAVLATAPTPVSNRDFGSTLGRVLRRPAVLPAPVFALRLLLGEMAQALLLSSQRCTPKALAAAGFVYEHGELETALRAVLAKG